MPDLPQFHGFAEVDDPEPGRTALEGRARGRHGAVAVAVGLDDGERIHGADRRAQGLHVLGDRAGRDDRFAHHGTGSTRSAIT